MSGPLAEWSAVHYPELPPPVRHVLVILCLEANHHGRNANLSRSQIHDKTGYSVSAISRYLRALDDAKAITQGPIPGRGQARLREVRVWWCDDRECWTCGLLAAHQHEVKIVSADNLYAAKVVTRRTKVVTGDNHLRYGTRLSAQHGPTQHTLAARTAALNLRVVE